PILAKLGREFREDKTIRDAAIILVVITECVVHIGLVPHIDDGVAAHIGETFRARLFLAPAFQAQRRAQAPIGLEVLANLPVDRADRDLEFFITDLAVGVIDDGYNHGECVRWGRARPKGLWGAGDSRKTK